MPMWYRLVNSLFLFLSEKFPDLECHPAPQSKPPKEGFAISFDSEDDRKIYENGLAGSPGGTTLLFLDCWATPNVKMPEIERQAKIAELQAKAESAVSEWASSLPCGDLEGSFFVTIPRTVSDAGAFRPQVALRLFLKIDWNTH